MRRSALSPFSMLAATVLGSLLALSPASAQSGTATSRPAGSGSASSDRSAGPSSTGTATTRPSDDQGRATARPGPRGAAPDEPVSPRIRLGLDRALSWTVADPEQWIDARRGPKRTIDDTIERSTLLDTAIEQARATGRLVFWYIPRIVEEGSRGRQMYRAPVLDLYASHVFFNDPELVALLEARFVPVRLACDQALFERFGLAPLEFVEPAYMVLDGSGDAVHACERLRTFDAAWLLEQLRTTLLRFDPEHRPTDGQDPLRCIAEGRYDLAEGLLRSVPGPGSPRHVLAAAVLARRTRDHERALAILADAGGTLPTGDLLAERNLCLLRAGRPHDVDVPGDLVGARSAEAIYLAAVAAYETADDDRAVALLDRVLDEYPDTPFGARARANLVLGPDARPYGPLFTGFEHLGALPERAFESLADDTIDPAAGRIDADALVAAGVRELLRLQRADGGFRDSRYAYWPSPEITPNTWIAISALAATALHTWRGIDPATIDPATVDAAVRRAADYLFAPQNLNRGENEDVYADTYRLLFLVRCSADAVDDDERADLIERMNAIVADAAQRQHEDGFWAHEYRNAFCTAAMLTGLGAARSHGAEVPDELFSRGVTALVSARSDSGAFAYGGTAERRTSSIKDSSTRMPSCEGILYALGHSGEGRVVAAYDAFWEHMDRIERVRRNDFHSDGELGGFFFFHALFHATELAHVLPPAPRAAHARRTIELVRRIPEIDGAFLDSHEIGRSYGTAMALLCLDGARRLLDD